MKRNLDIVDWNRECAAVIPCHNEAAHIGQVLAEVRNHLSHVVVDDGSTDRTANLAAAANVDLLRLKNNLGKGRALQAGWQRAANSGSNGC